MTHSASTALLSAALQAAERGWPVIPIQPGAKRPAGHAERACPNTGRCAGGHRKPEERATTDLELIHAAWGHRAYNVGIATGPAGLLVLDLDPVKAEEPEGAPDGATSLMALCERTGQAVPETYRVRTPRGGSHLYFTAPKGVRLGCSVDRLGRHIDTRGWGGYVVAPGSTTAQGAYEVTHDGAVAPLPAWLIDLLSDQPSLTAAPVVPVRVRDCSKAARAAVEAECHVVRTTGEGSRNATLHNSACKLGRFVAWGDIRRDVVEQAIQEAGEAAGLPPAECRTTVRSALDWVIAHATPRQAA